MPTEHDRNLLPLIDRALAVPGWLPPVPGVLRADYEAERLLQCRLFNRRVLLALTVVFDLFWFNEARTAPEILALSALLRFCVLTPAALGFVLLDIRGWFGRFYAPCLLGLAMAPGLIAAVLCASMTSPAGLLDVRAMPLILLGTSLALRMPPREVMLNAALTVVAFCLSILACQVLPRAEISSLGITDVAIAVVSVAFNLQLEWRDRRMFLLYKSEQIIRARLAARNKGLLRETMTDAVTGIANRRCFDDSVALLWRQGLQRQKPVGLIMIDIDHFKAYNDWHGHQDGDECLRQVAEQMAAQIRDPDVLARYGGDEFAIILPDGTPKTVQAVAERVRAGVEALALVYGGESPAAVVTVSLGLASITPTAGVGVEALIARADGDLYAVKRGGRNRAGSCGGLCAPDKLGA